MNIRGLPIVKGEWEAIIEEGISLIQNDVGWMFVKLTSLKERESLSAVWTVW